METSSYDDLRSRIADAQSSMPKRLAQAAAYVIGHPDDMALGTAASIAKAAEIQPSALVRLAHHLGYEGFSDLQSVFRERLKSRASTYDERLKQLNRGPSVADDDGKLLYGFVEASLQSLTSLRQNVNIQDFARAVEILEPAKIIYLIARRRAYPLTAHMSYAFGKLDIRSMMVNSANVIDDEIVAGATAKDAAIICSFSPYTPQTINQADYLANRGVPIVAITDSPMSPLCRAAAAWIEVAETDFAGFRSISASMTVAVALPVAIAERRHRIA
jgi:DNA-binding MurR/RpiR family transcriptional regulator